VRSRVHAKAGVKGVREPVVPVHNDYTIVQTQLLDLKKAQNAMDYAVTFAQRWPQQKFNDLLLRRALRIREAAVAVALACLPKN
jgi:hypothetical protein